MKIYDVTFYERKKIVQVCPGLWSFVHEFTFGVEHISLDAIMSVVSWILEYSLFFFIELFESNDIVSSKLII